MQIALNIDTAHIQNQEVLKFIQNKSIDELKSLFLQFLAKQTETTPKKTKHKWAEFGEKMNGRISEETANELIASSREFREGFSFRDLESTK